MPENEAIWVYDRMRLYRLLKQHPDWSVARLAQGLSRSERWVKKWRQRFRSASQQSLALFCRQPYHGSGSKIPRWCARPSSSCAKP